MTKNIKYFVLVLLVVITGCDNKDKQASSKSSVNSQTRQTAMKISDNRDFFSKKEIIPKTPAAKDLDSVIKPILKNLFDDARIVTVNLDLRNPTPEDTVLDSLHYSVRRLLDIPAGDELYKELLANKFSPSPRLGSKPQHGKTCVYISVFKRTSKGQYSLIFILDTLKQSITVESFKLGTKYDQL